MTVDRVEVWIWGSHVASLADVDGRITFRYTPEFQTSGIELSPIQMTLSNTVYSGFERLNYPTFRGLPELVADSLPDRFGQTLIDQWLVVHGRAPGSFTPLEQLCYIGSRGMGALEYRPATERTDVPEEALEVAELADLASAAIANKQGLVAAGLVTQEELTQILSVGTSAGGARAKAVIAWNRTTNEVRSGQLPGLPEGFEHWLLKFDGVSENRDKEALADPDGYGRVEYAYSLMAAAAGIKMAECRLLEEGGRAHFMTRRFDRVGADQRLHYQSLNAMAGYDYNIPQSASYEQALMIMRRIGVGPADIEQQVRRCLFNLVVRNQDDHTKNIGFLMDRSGRWDLAPAFDITFAYNPDGRWTNQHQMTVNLKSHDFTRHDVYALATAADMSLGAIDGVLGEVLDIVARWPTFADAAGVLDQHRPIERLFRRL